MSRSSVDRRGPTSALAYSCASYADSEGKPRSILLTPRAYEAVCKLTPTACRQPGPSERCEGGSPLRRSTPLTAPHNGGRSWPDGFIPMLAPLSATVGGTPRSAAPVGCAANRLSGRRRSLAAGVARADPGGRPCSTLLMPRACEVVCRLTPIACRQSPLREPSHPARRRRSRGPRPSCSMAQSTAIAASGPPTPVISPPSAGP